MGKYQVRRIDGTYEVEADSGEQAAQQVDAHRQQEMNKQFTTEAENAPVWMKPVLAAQDAGNVAQHALTLGWAPKIWDKLLGTEDLTQMKTKASQNRMGFAGSTLEAASLVGAMPSLASRVTGAVAGGPLTRYITSLIGGGAEGGALGAVTAAGNDRDPATGAAIGVPAGMLGPTAGAIINKGQRMIDVAAAKRAGLPDPYEAPPYKLPQSSYDALTRKPTRMDEVNRANTEADKAAALATTPGAKQNAIRSEFAKIDPRTLTPGQQEALDRVINKDPGTKITGALGDWLSNKFAVGALGGVGAATLHPGALAAAGGMLAAGKLLKGASLGGTQAAAQDLRRMIYGVPEFRGPVSEAAKTRISNAMRQLGLDYTDENR